MASAAYHESVARVRAWLAEAGLDQYAGVLVRDGYDDLDSLKRCNPTEMLELLAFFGAGDDRLRARRHLDDLRGIVRRPNRDPVVVASRDTSPDLSRSLSPTKEFTDSADDESVKEPPKRHDDDVVAHDECRVGVFCPYLYGDNWVDRYLVLHDAKLWAYPNNTVCENCIFREFSSDLWVSSFRIKCRNSR